MAERLAPTFAKHEIRLETSAAISPGLAGAELAIVGAHGAVHEREGRFFNAVHDEGGQALRPEQVARAVSGAKVVILFVCSGARLDSAPVGRGSVGLAHRLLDQGCSAVVGSPWPVSSSVPVYWLPTFLEAWEAGLPVIDANHYANEAVSRHLGTEPEVMFAMHVYGDPLVAKS
jgi:poly-gamma-glutamate capsule biosynthesis protein CapA/YwtB (metallophosphatase superfamily)